MDSLVDIDEDLIKSAEDSKDDTETFYQSIARELNGRLISDLSHRTIKKIAVNFSITQSHSFDWQDVIEPLLEKEYDKRETLAEIQTAAEVNNMLPLYHALRYKVASSNQTIGKLVEVLLELNSLLVLRKIQPDIRDLLSKEEHLFKQNQNIYSKENLSLCLNTSSLNEHNSKNIVLNIFIPHTNKVSEKALKLSSMLKNEFNCKVRTMHEIVHLLPVDSRGILDVILSKMDFILPVVSPDYLNIISFAFIPRDDDQMRNLYIYRWLGNEYENNGCLNWRCRPVVVNGVDVTVVRRIPLFFQCFGVNDIQKLVEHLYLTKRDMPVLIKRRKKMTKLNS